MSAQVRLIRAGDTRRTRWKNDGGWTTELASDPPARDGHAIAEGFRWRVSIADIERNGPFSTFPGVERDLLLLAGNGLELDIDDAAPLRIDRRFEQVHFAGEQDVRCRLLAGPTRDFNVMARRDAVHAEVVARPLAGSMLVFREAGTTALVHVLAGDVELHIDDQAIGAATGETLLLDAGSTRQRIQLEGAGEIVLVLFSAVS